mmetsp:Transcript_14123/g.24862  ORF Transcript_14123/g.24862 Transcript_14123/m.24862 type:complete len:209 (-) Transcript_14123:200-826(-)
MTISYDVGSRYDAEEATTTWCFGNGSYVGEPAKIAVPDLSARFALSREPAKVNLPAQLQLSKSLKEFDINSLNGGQQRDLEAEELPLEDLNLLWAKAVWTKPLLSGSPTHIASDETEMPLLPMPSLGSAFHGTGRCRPCAWYWKPRTCLNAKDCGYCHLCPKGELKFRKKAKLATLRVNGFTPKSSKSSSDSGSERGGTTVLSLSSLL